MKGCTENQILRHCDLYGSYRSIRHPDGFPILRKNKRHRVLSRRSTVHTLNLRCVCVSEEEGAGGRLWGILGSLEHGGLTGHNLTGSAGC